MSEDHHNCKIRSSIPNKAMVAIMSVIMVLTLVTTMSCSVSYAADEIKEPYVGADSYVVMSGSTSEVIHDVHAERKMPMGNITKFMTAMVVIDNMYDDSEFSNIIQVTKKVSSYGDMFRTGDNVSVEDMMYAMLIGGSDEAAEALARYSASNRETFVNEMNAKVMELSLMNTQYHNPTGRYHTDHYSTALDSAKIVQAAVRYSRIKEITSTDTHKIEIKSKSKGKTKTRSLTVINTNPLLSSNKSGERYKYITGGILGTVDEPGKGGPEAQYVGVASSDGMQLITVMLNGNEDRAARDAIALFRYGYKKVTKNTIFKAGQKVGKAKVRNGAVTKVDAYTQTKGYAYIPPEGSTNLVQTEIMMYDDLHAPLKAGDKVGEYRIYVADELKGTVDLITKDDVAVGWFPSRMYISNVASIFMLLALVLVVLLLIRMLTVRKRREKKRAAQRAEKIRQEALRQIELEEDRRRRNWTYK